jgi:hypothetical protein
MGLISLFSLHWQWASCGGSHLCLPSAGADNFQQVRMWHYRTLLEMSQRIQECPAVS